jgi:hypothetical protein
VIGATVTATSGNTYTNNGGIPLPVATPITITGHGVGVSVLQLSAGFTRGFDFYAASPGTAYSYKRVTIRGITFDRNNLTAANIAPMTTVTALTTLPSGTWTTVPGPVASAWANAKVALSPSTNSGTTANTIMACRVSGGNVQVIQYSGSSLTLANGDQIGGALWDHVIVGTQYWASLYGSGYNTSIDQLHVEDCESINVTTTAVNGISVLAATKCASIGISITNSSAASTPTVTNFQARNVRMYGGTAGINVIGNSTGVYLDEIWAIDCFHDTMVNPIYNYNSNGFLFGYLGWLNRCGLVRCKGRRSGDVAYEFDQPWEAHEIDCVWEEAFTGLYSTTFTPPARTSSGPPTTTLSAAITSTSATTATITALPSGVARSGVIQIGSEILGYAASSSTALTLQRGLNGTTAATALNGATVTFVETAKTRIFSIRSTIRNNLALAVSGAGRGYTSYSNYGFPLPPLTIRDTSADYEGAVATLTNGQFIYWSGWRPDLDIQGVRYSHDGLSYTTSDSTYGSVICWYWPTGQNLYVSGTTSDVGLPAPRVYGRNNSFRVHGTTPAPIPIRSSSLARGMRCWTST